MLLETANHFVNKGSNVYVVFLDASKAFDRVCYTKLFRALLKRGMNKLYIRCLIYMYTNQKLCVSWNGFKTNSFSVSNGVKQGGVLSPLLFSVYVDGLFMRLRSSGYGCRMGPHFLGAFGYADDICILCLTPNGLRKMITICETYAVEYCIEFNGSKCEMLILSRRPLPLCMRPCVKVNNTVVPIKDSVIHLGNKISSDVTERHVDYIVAKFYKQYNLFLSRFGKVSSLVKSQLFATYCCSFYGITLCDLSNTDSALVALRKCIRQVWRISPRTHCDLLPHISGICNHIFMKRFAKYFNNAMKSENDALKYVFAIAASTPGSPFSNNVKMICDTANRGYLNGDMELSVSCECFSVEELPRKSYFIKELCMVRDGHLQVDLSHNEIQELLDYMCLS